MKEKLLIVPRVYTNKPRTKGVGYKGMLHQPDPEKKEDMVAGIIAIRQLHMRVIRETGFTCAEEMLYPSNHSYLSDLLGYVAVGARSVEDQEHRLVASGLGIAVGMKNPTAGDISVMMNSIAAAQSPQEFIYRNWEVRTTGNPLAHAILRGYVDSFGRSHPNYHYENLRNLLKLYRESGLEREDFIRKVVIDVPMPVSYLKEELIGELELLEPFGKGNEKPVFAERGLHPVRAAVIGKNQNVLKFQMESTDGVRMEALYFGDPQEMLEYLSVRYSHAEVERMLQGRENAVRMDVLYYPSVNEFRGMRTIQIVITGYR